MLVAFYQGHQLLGRAGLSRSVNATITKKINNMTKIKSILLAAGCAAVLSLSTGNVAAQGPRNFDPAQMRERMVSRYKDSMEVTDDAEWKVLEAAIGKVVDARMEVMSGQFGRGGPRGNNTNNASGDQAGQRRNRGPFGTPSVESEDLQKAIDAKAPADEIKAKLAKLRESNTAKEAKLVEAQDELKKLLTARQEAVAVLGGLLK
jgi:hypothetical protein